LKYIYGNNVLVTGGSSGIGLATAELFAKYGYTVFAASRNPHPEIRKFTGGGEIHPVVLDVRDIHSIKKAAESVLAQADIGIVIHCAGVGIACAGEEYPIEPVKDLMETNFHGVLQVNSFLLPHLRKRGKGLCIIVGSLAGIFPIPYQSHYCASKAALDLYAGALRMELSSFGINVCLVMPGDTNTDFTGARKYEIDKFSLHYDACIKAVGKMEKDELTGKPPSSVANAILKLSNRKNPPVKIAVGLEYKLMIFFKRFLPDRFIEHILRRNYLK